MATQTSCISHPARQRLVVLREDYFALCDSNHCAAALLNFFEHGHNRKLSNQQDAIHANEVAKRHGDPGMQSTSLLQFHTQNSLEEGLLGLYQRSAIRKGLQIITKKGYVSVHKNPNPRYHFDKTHYFLFHPEIVQPQLIEMFDESFFSHRREENTSWREEKLSSSEEKLSSSTRDYVPEIASEDPSSVGLLPGKVVAKQKVKRSPPLRSHVVPIDFVVTDAMAKWAQKECPAVDLRYQTALFMQHEFEKLHSDWVRTWKAWMLRSPEFTTRNVTSPLGKKTSKTMDRESFKAEAEKFKGRL